MHAIETRTFEQNGRTYRLSLFHDHDAPNPLDEWSEMGTILSLNRRHNNYDPEGVGRAIEGNPDAVPLGYHEHGLCLWTPADELPDLDRCPWDSVSVAGVWLPDAGTLASARHYGGRTRRLFLMKRARQSCEVYSMWCNGQVYGYEVELIVVCPCCDQEQPRPIGSCWGFYGLDSCLSEATACISSLGRQAG